MAICLKALGGHHDQIAPGFRGLMAFKGLTNLLKVAMLRPTKGKTQMGIGHADDIVLGCQNFNASE